MLNLLVGKIKVFLDDIPCFINTYKLLTSGRQAGFLMYTFDFSPSNNVEIEKHQQVISTSDRDE